MPAEDIIRATIPVPDHSDLRGFSYRAPTNTQGYNDDPKKSRPRGEWRGQLSTRKVKKGWWARLTDFIRGKNEDEERPMGPELVNHIRSAEPANEKRSEELSPRPARELPRDQTLSNVWPG